MKQVLAYAVFGLLMYGVFLVAGLPAAWAYTWGKERLGDITLTGISGTLWDGRARGAQLGQFRVEKLRWDVRPWTLLLGRLGVGMEFNYESQPARLTASRHLGGALSLRDVELLLPARSLQGLLRLPGVELGGEVDVDLARVGIEQGRIAAAEGGLSWNRAAVVRPVVAQLGGFTVTLETVEGEIKGVLRDQGEAVQAEGLFTMKGDGNYQFTASLVSRDPRQPAIAQGLRLFGEPGPDGRVKINAQGVLPPLLPGGG